MTVTVTKTVAYVAIGPAAAAVAVTKIIGFVIYDTSALATPTAHVKKRVSVRGRIVYP